MKRVIGARMRFFSRNAASSPAIGFCEESNDLFERSKGCTSLRSFGTVAPRFLAPARNLAHRAKPCPRIWAFQISVISRWRVSVSPRPPACRNPAGAPRPRESPLRDGGQGNEVPVKLFRGAPALMLFLAVRFGRFVFLQLATFVLHRGVNQERRGFHAFRYKKPETFAMASARPREIC
jgi:hypothetical protein